MKIHCKYDELVDPKSLKPYPKNRNKHPKDQIARLAKILEDQGWRYAIKVSKLSGCVTSGHGRIEAAKINKWKEVPIVYQDYIDSDQEYRDVQADNAIASWAELDLAAINLDIPTLGPFDIDLLGIKDFQVDPVDKYADKDADAVPKARKTDIKLGDLFQLGKHRLLCGDATSTEDVARLMNGERAKLLFTDPPYGVDYEGIENDHLKAEELRRFIVQALNWPIEAGACYYIFHPDIHAYEFIGAVRDLGWKQARPPVLQWVKDSLVMSQGDYHSRNEPCLYGWVPGAGHKRVEDRTQDTIWEFPKPKKAEGHPTMKPVELIERALRNSSENQWLIIDPFLGSGSTLIACEKTNRKCFGMEIDPQYCQVIIDRWEKFTGQKAQKLNETTKVIVRKNGKR